MTLELRKTKMNRTLRLTLRMWFCLVRRLDHESWTSRDGRRPYSTNNWLNQTTTWECRMTGKQPTLDDYFLASLPFVCGGRTTTWQQLLRIDSSHLLVVCSGQILGSRKMERNNIWLLISRIYAAVLSLKMGVKDKVCFFHRVVYDNVGSSKILWPRSLLEPNQQYHKSLPFQWSWIIIL